MLKAEELVLLRCRHCFSSQRKMGPGPHSDKQLTGLRPCLGGAQSVAYRNVALGPGEQRSRPNERPKRTNYDPKVTRRSFD